MYHNNLDLRFYLMTGAAHVIFSKEINQMVF